MFRMLLCFDQNFAADHIELHVLAAAGEIGANEERYFSQILIRLHGGRVELDIEQRRLVAVLADFHGAVHKPRWTFQIAPAHGGHGAVRQALARKAAIGRGAGLRAARPLRRDRNAGRLVRAAETALQAGRHISPIVKKINGDLIRVIIAIAVFRRVEKTLAQIFPALPIAIQHLDQLRLADEMLLEHKLFHGDQRVDHIDHADHVQQRAVFKQIGAIEQRLAFLQPAVHQHRAHRIGKQFAADLQLGVVFIGVEFQEVPQLRLEGGVEIIKRLEVLELAGRQADGISGPPHHAIQQRRFEHHRHDKHAHRRGARFAGQGHVEAAADGVIARLFQGHALVQEIGDIGTVADEGWHAGPQLDDFQRLLHQRLGRAVMNPQRHRVMRGRQTAHRFQDQIGQRVGGVLPALGEAANHHVVPFRHAGIFLARGLARRPIELHVLDAQALQKFQRVLFGQAAIGDICFIIGVHELIKAAHRCSGRRRDHQEDEPEALHRLAECARRMGGNAAADRRDRLKLGPSCRVRFGRRLVFGQRGITLGEAHDRAQRDDRRLEKMRPFQGVFLGILDRSKALLSIANQGKKAFFQHHLKIDRHQIEARPQAQPAFGVAAARAVAASLPRRQHHAGFQKTPHLLAGILAKPR